MLGMESQLLRYRFARHQVFCCAHLKQRSEEIRDLSLLLSTTRLAFCLSHSAKSKWQGPIVSHFCFCCCFIITCFCDIRPASPCRHDGMAYPVAYCTTGTGTVPVHVCSRVQYTVLHHSICWCCNTCIAKVQNKYQTPETGGAGMPMDAGLLVPVVLRVLQ